MKIEVTFNLSNKQTKNETQSCRYKNNKNEMKWNEIVYFVGTCKLLLVIFY